ncbi:hypothetical protein FS749_015663, partial [Ceratobasidium sp. UAMH 11750]
MLSRRLPTASRASPGLATRMPCAPPVSRRRRSVFVVPSRRRRSRRERRARWTWMVTRPRPVRPLQATRLPLAAVSSLVAIRLHPPHQPSASAVGTSATIRKSRQKPRPQPANGRKRRSTMLPRRKNVGLAGTRPPLMWEQS